MIVGGVILPVPTSGRAGRAEKALAERRQQAAAGNSRASGSPRVAKNDGPDFDAIMAVQSKRPDLGTYTLPSAFDPVYSRAPKVAVSKAGRETRFMGTVDLFQAAKGPAPGKYTPRAGFTGADRSQRRKLAIERFNAHAPKVVSSLPPITTPRTARNDGVSYY
jgi:hypothetical protein